MKIYMYDGKTTHIYRTTNTSSKIYKTKYTQLEPTPRHSINIHKYNTMVKDIALF